MIDGEFVLCLMCGDGMEKWTAWRLPMKPGFLECKRMMLFPGSKQCGRSDWDGKNNNTYEKE
jgi:hypothetical protein